MRISQSASRREETSIRGRAYACIQRKIASGGLVGGAVISEVALAAELGVSRTPVREAIAQLVAEGMLDQTPNRGAVVIQLKRHDIIELFELREALECYAVTKAARQAVPEAEVKHLEALADSVLTLKEELERSGQAVLNAELMHRFVGYDLGYHTLLMRLAANSRISKIVNETRLLIRVFAMSHAGHRAPELEKIHREHREILRCVLSGDSARAVQILSVHIQNSCRERLEAYDHREREASLRESLPAFFEAPSL